MTLDFILGLLIGGPIGVIIMAMLVAGKDGDVHNEEDK